MSNNSVKTFIKNDGERYCLLVDIKTGIPLYYPNLYITTQVRNKSLSYSSMEASLTGISVLLKFMYEKGEDLETRFKANDYFKVEELDAIRDYCQIKFTKRTMDKGTNGLFSLDELRIFDEKVSSQTEYSRLSVISSYVKWLAEFLSSGRRDKMATLQISKMAKGLQSRRPSKKSRNSNSNQEDKGLNTKQFELVFEVFRPDSDLNPFRDEGVRERNRLMFLVLFYLGLRGGELLNIRIRDINFASNQLVVVRRADEKDDSRTYQPLVKTLDRRIPLKNTLADQLHQYITNDRKKIPNVDKHDFLFVTHKSGPTQGQPISKSGYKKIFEVVRITCPGLYNLHGHKLRHTWNERFSELMDAMDKPPSEERQEEMHSYLMGWKADSGTAAIYNHRFVKNKSAEAALDLQENMVRVPKGMKNNE
jgi:integrase